MKEIKCVTIVGANGTMGRNIAAIFAAFGKANVYLVSRSVEKSVEAKNIACFSVKAESIKERMFPSDYEHLDKCVKNSDLVFEACAEDWEIKKKIHKMIVDACGDRMEEKYSVLEHQDFLLQNLQKFIRKNADIVLWECIFLILRIR